MKSTATSQVKEQSVPCITMRPGEIPPGLNAFQTYQVYNCLDAAVTAQLVEPMLAQANANHLTTYSREMRLQSLCLDMSSKGFPISKATMLNLLHELEKEMSKSLTALHTFCRAVYAPPLNPNSSKQVPEFFYDYLGIPVIWKYDYKTKTRKRAADRDALEKLRDQYPLCVPFVNAILAYREARKLAGVFKKGLEPGNGRLRCNFSPSGTETGRLSSQTNPYQRGTNAQNLNDRVRQVVVAPHGWCLAYLDLKTAESIAVGYLSGDRGYITACLSGDLHTTVAEMTWRDLGWRQGDLAFNRAIADQLFYRDFSYRDMSKRGGHASNYYGKPREIAKHLKVQASIIEAFQQGYFAAFPGIPDWQLETIARVQREGVLVTPLGRERRFWGRANDASTHREAIANVPQSLVADVMDEGLMQVQAWLLRECPAAVKMSKAMFGTLAQVHDAGVFCLPINEAADMLPIMLERIVYPVDFGELGVMRIPAEAQIGLNWAKHKPDKNPTGLRDWKPGEELKLS